MTIDRYTKIVLTVIAISLSTIALQHVIPSAFAQQSARPVKVVICDSEDTDRCARVGFLNNDSAYRPTPRLLVGN
jgi:hypothetical protein